MITLIGTLLSVLFWYLKEYSTKTSDPVYRRQERSNEIDKEILTDNADAANVRLDQWLREIQSNQRRESGDKSQGGTVSVPTT
jgi:hypothetical protein